jgi:hypothetical protein
MSHAHVATFLAAEINTNIIGTVFLAVLIRCPVTNIMDMIILVSQSYNIFCRSILRVTPIS